MRLRLPSCYLWKKYLRAILWQKSVNVLLYPQSDAVRKTGIKYVSDDNVNVRVSFVDLKNVDDSISNLLTEVC